MTRAYLVVTVAYAAPGVETLVEVKLFAPATVSEAVAKSELVARLALEPAHLEFAVYGQRVDGATPVTDGDRVELTRPLVADPKQVRRVRARHQL